jgi:hypothetical protein
VTRVAVELGQSGLEVGAHIARDLFQPDEVTAGEGRVPALGGEDQVGVQRGDTVPASAGVNCQWP